MYNLVNLYEVNSQTDEKFHTNFLIYLSIFYFFCIEIKYIAHNILINNSKIQAKQLKFTKRKYMQ